MLIKKWKKTISISLIATTLCGIMLSPRIIKAAEENISSNLYAIEENYILDIAEDTTVEKFLQNVASKDSEEIKIYKNGNEANAEETIQTGMELKVGEATYLLVINGDINGDGRVSTVDIAIAKTALTKQRTLEGALFQAVDINHDGKISSVDVAQMRMHIVGLININKSPEENSGEDTERPVDETIKDIVPAVLQKINNSIIVAGLEEGNYRYYYSKDDGTNWEPEGGTTEGIYEFNNILENSTVKIKVKRIDETGKEVVSETEEVRAFKTGTQMVQENMNNVQIEENTIIVENGDKYEINNTEEGGYSVTFVNRKITEDTKSALEVDKEILENINNLEVDISHENPEKILLNKVIEEGIIAEEKVNIETNMFITPNGNVYYVFKNEDSELEENPDQKFRFIYTMSEEEYNNNVLSGTKLEQINAMKEELTSEDKVTELLNKIVSEGILEADKVDMDEKTFILPNQSKYRISEEEGEIIVQPVIHEEMSIIEYIQAIEHAINTGITNQLIDWAIADGKTTEENVNRAEGMYTTTEEGKTYKITVDLWFGNYSIEEYENNVEINENAEGEEYVENEN